MLEYSSDQVDMIEARRSDDGATVDIQVLPMLETAFFLAGASLSEVDGRRKLMLVRCGLGTDCAVDVVAEITPGTADPYRMVLDGAETPVDVVYADKEVEIYTP